MTELPHDQDQRPRAGRFHQSLHLIYDQSGAVDESEVDQIISGVKDVNDLIWEAPIKNQQQYLIMRFGINVNLGNVPPADILALEALRNGLRGDTLKKALERGVKFTG